MKKSSAQIREAMARLQEQLKTAETDEALRIGRVALKAGLGNVNVEDEELREAFVDLATRFRGRGSKPTGERGSPLRSTTAVAPGSTAHGTKEA